MLAANAEDGPAGPVASATVVARLRLDDGRVEAMAGGLRQVAALQDPVGEVLDGWTRPNGLRISRVRVPLGVVAIIYENRPNVTSDAAGLCLKSGNAAILRGSSGAITSNIEIASVLRQAYAKVGCPRRPGPGRDVREAAVAFMQQRRHRLPDPRGGASLIRSIRQRRCRTIDETATATSTSAPATWTWPSGSCATPDPAALVYSAAARSSSTATSPTPSAPHGRRAGRHAVGDAATRDRPGRGAAEDDWANEFLDLKLAVGVVDSIDRPSAHRSVTRAHEAIVTTSLGRRQFTSESTPR